MKRGQIWISAVLYIALGLLLITLVLSAGVPVINKLRDRNAYAETKELMFTIDNNIRTVSTEGPGSKRFLSPLNIDRGELVIDVENDQITWSMRSKFKPLELGTVFQEGSLLLFLNQSEEENEFVLNLKLDYFPTNNITLDSSFGNPFVGTYSMSIEHTGNYVGEKPTIKIGIS